jgi:hypothetical protein
MLALRIVAGAVLTAALLVFAPLAILPLIAPDAAASPAVQRLLPEAKQHLAVQLGLWGAYVRYSGVELRERDDLVILQFELRPSPFVHSEGAYLVSRCTPLDELDPNDMGGGRGVTDFTTDSELAYLRSDAQPACQ